MRCGCCDKALTDYECSLRIISTDEFADICIKCLQGLQIETKGNLALKHKQSEDEEDYFDDFSDIPFDFRQSTGPED